MYLFCSYFNYELIQFLITCLFHEHVWMLHARPLVCFSSINFARTFVLMRTCGRLKNQLYVSDGSQVLEFTTIVSVNKSKKTTSFDLERSNTRPEPPTTPPGYIFLLRLSSPDAGSPRSHPRPRHCCPGPLLRLGSPAHPHRRRCTGLRRPGWGPCIPARRGPSRPPACTSGRPGKTGPPWRWTDRGRVWRKQRGGGVRAGRGGGGVMREEKTEQSD